MLNTSLLGEPTTGPVETITAYGGVPAMGLLA